METKYESLSTYIMLAKKIINRFAPKFITKQMLNDEDAISDVAVALMNADKNFDPNRQTKHDTKKTLYSYRNQCGIWAIKTYVTKNFKNKKLSSLDFNSDSDSNSISSTIADNKDRNPLDILIQIEEDNNRFNDISYILKSSLLSDKQRDQIHMYYFEDKSLADIGRVYGITREAVRQNIKRAIDSIRSLV